MPILADRGLYIGSEHSFSAVLSTHGQAHRRGRARPPQEPRPVLLLRASGPNHVELEYELLAHHGTQRVAVTVPGDRRVEPQDGGLGCRRAKGSSHLSEFDEQG